MRLPACASQVVKVACLALNDTIVQCGVTGSDKLGKVPPQVAPAVELQALKSKMARDMDDIRGKHSTLTVQDVKRLLFRCAAMLISLNEVQIL